MKDEIIDICVTGVAAVSLAILYLVSLLLGSYLFSMSVLYSIVASFKLPGTELENELTSILLSNLLYGTVGLVFLISAYFLRKTGKKYANKLTYGSESGSKSKFKD